MSNLKDLQFNYAKMVNNLENQEAKNKLDPSVHKMEHQGAMDLCVKNLLDALKELELVLAEEGMQTFLADLDYYINWLRL